MITTLPDCLSNTVQVHQVQFSDLELLFISKATKMQLKLMKKEDREEGGKRVGREENAELP